MTDIPMEKVPLIFKLDVFVFKFIRGIIVFVIRLVKSVKKAKKRWLTLTKLKNRTIKGLNLAGSGYQLYSKAEPFIKSKLDKGEEATSDKEDVNTLITE